MGYFDRAAEAPPIPTPAGAQIWGEGAERTLTWRRPLGPCDGFLVLRGATPEALAEVARLPSTATRWPVPASGGPWLAVACLRGDAIGESGAPLRLGGEREGPPERPAEAGRPTTPERERPPEREAIEATMGATAWCGCCAPARPLAPGDGALLCPVTGELYAVLATGALARAAELPFGLCRCCEVRQPLIRCAGAVVCLARPEQAYRRVGGHYVAVEAAAEHVPLVDAAAIDAALRANTALLGVNGVFVSQGANRWRP